MKSVKREKQTLVVSKTYYDEYMCHNCQEKTKAIVLREQFVSDNCILMRIRCPKCEREDAPLVDRNHYKKHVIGGNYFKNTP